MGAIAALNFSAPKLLGGSEGGPFAFLSWTAPLLAG
jgi:hypothetical protein